MSEPTNPTREPRDEIADALRNYLTPEQLRKLFDEILVVTKEVWANCPHCKRKAKFQIPDVRAVTDSIVSLATQGFGRPPQAEASPEREPTVLVRKLYYGGVEAGAGVGDG